MTVSAGPLEPIRTVDAFVLEKVAPAFHELVALLRALMRDGAPLATEQMAYGVPMWKGNRYFAWVSPSKRHVSLGFTYGVTFADPYGLLRGDGKHARHVRLRGVGDVPPEAIRHYVAQAIARDLMDPAHLVSDR